MSVPVCKKCKSKLDVGSKFCSHCGSKTSISVDDKKSVKSHSPPNKTKPKNDVGVIPILLAAAIITFLMVGYVDGRTSTKENSLTGKIIAAFDDCKDVQVPYEEQEAYMKTEYYTETIPYTDTECESKKLVYSITDFKMVGNDCLNQVDECNKYFLGICTSKTTYCTKREIICSLMLNNLDNERGSWNIKFDFYKVGGSAPVATETVTEWLYPETSESVLGGTDEIITKEPVDTAYTCRYRITQEPTKQVCRDVIKYRDVQKERQVTAYRPVTKYRTEEKCNYSEGMK